MSKKTNTIISILIAIITLVLIVIIIVAAVKNGRQPENPVEPSTDITTPTENPDDPETVFSELYAGEAEDLMKKGIISGGMLPKIQNCLDALKGGISRIHIMDGRIPHSLLLEIFTHKGTGTAILGDKEEKYWNGK